MDERKTWSFYLPLFVLYFTVVNGITKDYLNLVCNTDVYVTTSRKLESSTALHYSPSVSCYYHVQVPVTHRVLLIVRYFELEATVQNVCVDFVNIHDGADVSAATVNTSPICGNDAAANYTSTGNDMTIYFETDALGLWRGFDFIFVAFTNGTCDSSQFSCNTSICIDSSLHCSVHDECGDNSDEDGCTYTTPKSENSDMTALITGLCICLLVAFVIGAGVAYFCWRYNRWRIFIKRPITAKPIVHDETTFTLTYPVTKVYYKERIQDLYRNPNASDIFGHTAKPEVETSTSTKRSETNEAFNADNE